MVNEFIEEVEDDEFDHTLQSERHEELMGAFKQLTTAVKENRSDEIQAILAKQQSNFEKLIALAKPERNDEIEKLGKEIKSSLEEIKNELKRKKKFSFSLDRKNLLLTGGTIEEK